MNFHRDTFAPIHNAIRGSHGSSEFDVMLHDRDDWYNLALSDIALLVDGDQILYADVSFDPSDGFAEPYEASILLVTNDLIVEVHGVWKSEETHDRTTVAWPRSALRSLEVRAEVAHDVPFVETHWPGRVSVTLDYGSDRVISLPQTRTHASNSNFDSLRSLVPSLRDDLNK